MSDEVLHAIDIKSVATNAIAGMILSLVLIFVPVSTLSNLIMILVGFVLIATNGFSLYEKIQTKKESTNDMLFDAIGILAGFILIFFANLVVTIIVAIYLIAQPLIQLVLSKFDRELIMMLLPKIVLGVILVFSGISTFDVIFKIIGVILLIASAAYFGINYFLYKKSGVRIVK